MDGQERSTTLHSSFISLCLVFRDAHSDQCADETTDSPTNAETGQSRHNRPRRDEGAHSRDGQSSDTGGKMA
jgi:hypothetical protein